MPRYDDDGGNATFAPSFNVDDDAVLLSNLLEQLTFKDVIFVGLTGLAASCALVGFFEVKRRTRSAHRRCGVISIHMSMTGPFRGVPS